MSDKQYPSLRLLKTISTKAGLPLSAVILSAFSSETVLAQQITANEKPTNYILSKNHINESEEIVRVLNKAIAIGSMKTALKGSDLSKKTKTQLLTITDRELKAANLLQKKLGAIKGDVTGKTIF